VLNSYFVRRSKFEFRVGVLLRSCMNQKYFELGHLHFISGVWCLDNCSYCNKLLILLLALKSESQVIGRDGSCDYNTSKLWSRRDVGLPGASKSGATLSTHLYRWPP